jgi:hypothetical protein
MVERPAPTISADEGRTETGGRSLFRIRLSARFAERTSQAVARLRTAGLLFRGRTIKRVRI